MNQVGVKDAATFRFGVSGYVKPGFEHVLEKYEELFQKEDDNRSQLVVYVGSEKVIDLFRGMSPESVTNYFSNGKTVAVVCLSSLYDKGLFEYTDPVSKHWPEFAQNGKENITIADVLRHEGGMPRIGDKPLQFNQVTTAEIKKNSIGSILEAQKPFFNKEARREYHTFTKDWITNEIFRRLDPQGRTIAEYIKQDLHSILGENGIIIGASESDLQNYVQVKDQSGWKTFKDLWTGP